MDVFTREKRSQVMAAIRGSRNRSTELRFAALLRCNRISGWKIREAAITGKPDFYFPEHRIAVFIDGCFWHGCPKCFKAPKQNALFWKEKIGRNRKRDLFVRRRLKSDGITVVRLWEHEIEKKAGTVAKVIARLRTHLDL